MPEIIPFRSYYYREGKGNPDKLKELVAPPYDVISEEEKIELEKNPDNIIHIILPKSYDSAKEKLDELISKNILVVDNKPCLYIYGIDYIDPKSGKQFSRYGFVGLLRLVELLGGKNGVIPHEMTFRKYTEDRLKLIQKTNGNFSPIFLIYNGDGKVESIIKKYIKKEPFLETIDRDGFTHKIWDVRDEKDIKKITDAFKRQRVIIADGHHRYITSLRHSRHGGCKYIMALFIDFNDPGLIIYTSHREVRNLNVKDVKELVFKLIESFMVQKVEDLEDLENLMEAHKDQHVFGCYYQKTFLFLKLKESIRPEDVIEGIHSDTWKNLNIPILHDILLKGTLGVKSEDITFIKDVKKGIERVDKGEIDALFLINPTTLSEIHTITRLGEIMPQKSTYFFPKPLSGFVVHIHSDNIE
ncbi:MAG: DUF1015 domain-containing protein [Promethearchaeota archaeon]